VRCTEWKIPSQKPVFCFVCATQGISCTMAAARKRISCGPSLAGKDHGSGNLCTRTSLISIYMEESSKQLQLRLTVQKSGFCNQEALFCNFADDSMRHSVWHTTITTTTTTTTNNNNNPNNNNANNNNKTRLDCRYHLPPTQCDGCPFEANLKLLRTLHSVQ